MADSPTPQAQSKALVFLRRSGSTIFLWGLVTWIFMSGLSWAFLALMGSLTLIATYEYFRMLEKASIKCFPRFGMFVSVVYCAYLSYGFLQGKRSIPENVDAFAIFFVIAGSFVLLFREPIRGIDSLMAVASTLFGYVYIVFLFNFTARVTFLIPSPDGAEGMVGSSGAFLLLWLLAVTKFTDMGAYIVGSMIGRHKMIPHVSPGKTWEGLGGAILFSQLAACGLYALFPAQLAFFKEWGHVVFLGFILAVLAVIGDLAESVVKRSLNAKDSGRILPGIGGSLDLIDSICFTAPALYFYLKWVLLPPV
jgi:phosphatidate cytidylyltransferase